METRNFAIGLLAILTGACSTHPDPPTDAEALALRGEVASALSAHTEAMSSGDPERVFSFYKQDDRFFYLGCTDVLFGWGTFSSRVEFFYRDRPELTFEREILSIQILEPTVAVVAMAGRSSEADGLFWTEVLQKQEDGRWLITYEHESWPGCSRPGPGHSLGDLVPGDPGS